MSGSTGGTSKVRALYEAWGYEYLGAVLPFTDSPLYDALVLNRHA
ncbi:hypothetical protein [Streptomyces sp. NPDC055189]